MDTTHNYKQEKLYEYTQNIDSEIWIDQPPVTHFRQQLVPVIRFSNLIKMMDRHYILELLFVKVYI